MKKLFLILPAIALCMGASLVNYSASADDEVDYWADGGNDPNSENYMYPSPEEEVCQNDFETMMANINPCSANPNGKVCNSNKACSKKNKIKIVTETGQCHSGVFVPTDGGKTTSKDCDPTDSKCLDEIEKESKDICDKHLGITPKPREPKTLEPDEFVESY